MSKNNFVDKFMRIGETGWKAVKRIMESKKKYKRKKKHKNKYD